MSSQRRLFALLLLLTAAPAAAHEVETPPRTPPVLVERVEPSYPEAARKAGVGGTVGLEILVGKSGAVEAVRLRRPAGFGLDEAAMAAAWRFRFRPATEGEEATRATVLFDQRFVLRPHLGAEPHGEPLPEPPAPPQASPREPRYESTVRARGPSSAASASTIRNLDFDLRPKTSPNDILRVVPGLLAVQHQGGGKADQLFLRGFDADHGTDVGVFVDGVPINLPSHAHGQGFADLHWLIPEALERIDVVKGPYDARYGDFATAGAINLVTRTRFESSSVQYTMGLYPSIPGRAVAAGRFVGIAAPHLGGWAEKLHPWIAFEAAYDQGPFVVSEALKRYNLFAKIGYDVSPALTIGLFVSAYGSGWVGSGQIPAREVQAGRLSPFGSLDPSEGGLTQRQMLTGFLRYHEGDHELTATAYFTRYRLALWNDFTFFLEDAEHGSELEQDDARTVAGARAAYHFHRRWRQISLRTTLGGESRFDNIHVDRWDAESQNGDFRKRLGRHVDTSELAAAGNNDNIAQLNVAAYAEEDVVLSRYFRVIAALRTDYFSFNVDDLGEALGAGMKPTSGTRQFVVVSPKASAMISPLPDLLDLYLNYGTGFHTNQARVALNDRRVITDADGSQFQVHALPRLYGGELGARTHLFNRLDLAAAFWLSYLENETVFDADHSTFSPAQPTRRIGFDFELRARLTSWLFADFDLAQASATAVADQGNGGAVALAPRLRRRRHERRGRAARIRQPLPMGMQRFL